MTDRYTDMQVRQLVSCKRDEARTYSMSEDTVLFRKGTLKPLSLMVRCK